MILIKRCPCGLLLWAVVVCSGSICPAIAKYNEAPELARLVREGKLPPVEERLPKQPLVVTPYESIGEYGGIWRRLMKGTSDIHAFNRINYEMLLRYAPDPKDGILPNIVERWEFSDDFRAITLYLRQGIRWSDGAPFSADDIVFCWERLMNDPRITPAVPSYLRPGGVKMNMVQIDRYTVRLEFAQPYPLILDYLAFRAPQWPFGQERYGLFAPKHYLEGPLNRTKIVDGVEVPDPDYETLEKLACDFNTERPVLGPWRISLWDAGNRLVASRNPFYWKVDPAGNQLPYIDQVEHEIFYNPELINFRAVVGQIDMQLRHFQVEDLPLLRGFQRRGNHRDLLYKNSGARAMGICLNLEYRSESDPEMARLYRELFSKREFRQALSLAINRDLIRDVAFKGLTGPCTFDFPEESNLHVGDPDIDRWLVYDPDRANRMLDALGLDHRDGNGFRMIRDGESFVPLSIIVEIAGVQAAITPLEMVCAQLARVGIRMTIQPQDRTLNDLRVNRAGQHMATAANDGGAYPVLQGSMRFGVAVGSWSHHYAAWHNSRGREERSGVEPPAIVKRLQDIYDKMLTTNDQGLLRKLAEEVVRINAEEVFYIPYAGPGFYVGVAVNNMRNVPERASGSWVVSTPGNLNCATFFFRDGGR
ncbi:MAG TPA: ABC transporter substrate-binding protein [Sedimentisphaerales bacterium]|nr:ABC transporter substrate-binding protein [Sedimentisphaerales bacterium]